MKTDFHRISRLPPYIFEQVNRLKAEARARGEDIIDFGMGNPDMPTPRHIVDKLIETAQDPRANRYSASRGIKGLRRAMSGYYRRRFDVELDPETEVIATLGSKEGFANLAQAITSPGDVVLVPNPAYPIHAFGFILAGAAIRHVPATNPEEFLSRSVTAIRHSQPSPLALVVNYPSNPTAQVVDLDFYREVVTLAKRHEMWVLSDCAYADTYFDDANPPPSIFQVEGARDVAIEFQSLSKTYAMPGWRMGFAAGNQTLIAALGRIKSYLDYGAYTPIQVAAAAALNGSQECAQEIRAIYRSRRDVLVESMARAGWNIPSPPASMFAWAPIPEAFRAAGSMEFAKRLLLEAKVAVSPGVGFGEYGEGYVRIALVENEQRIRQAARNVRRFLDFGRNSQSHGSCQMSGELRVGLAGLGTVGAGVAQVLRDNFRALEWRAGRPLRLTAVSARDRGKDRGVDLAGIAFEPDALALAERDDVDVVVELVGGEEGAARSLVEGALRGRKHVVTANKALVGAPWRFPRGHCRAQLRRAEIRSRDLRWHPDREGAARGPDRV